MDMGAAHRVRRDGRAINLSPTNIACCAISSNISRVFSRQETARDYSLNRTAGLSCTVDVHIRRLRMAGAGKHGDIG
jgi:DNA-binding response OmpR family regulator